MGLVAEVGSFNSNTGTGNQTVNLGSVFNGTLPMFLLLWTQGSASAAVDTNVADAILAMGMGTRDGGATQQWYQSHWGDAGTDPSATVRGRGTGSILKTFLSDSTTPDGDWSLVSFSSGSPSTFVVNVVDAPAAATRIHYLAVGGTDISAAKCGSFNALTAGSTQDVTVGFRPDFLFFAPCAQNTGDVQGNGNWGMGVARDGSARHCSFWGSSDASAAAAISHYQKPRAVLGVSAGGTVDYEAELDAKASWPTDGFRLTYPDLGGTAFTGNFYLALAGTFQSACGSNSTLTAGSTQDNYCGFVPVCAGVFGGNQPTNASPVTSGTGVGAWGLGATDFTNERWAGCSIDDALATNARYDSRFSESKTLVEMTPETPTKEADADASISGENFRLTYSDLDSANREYGWWALGAAAVFPRVNLPIGARA